MTNPEMLDEIEKALEAVQDACDRLTAAQGRLSDLLLERAAPIVEEELEGPMPPTWRNRNIPLGDQCNSPGAMNFGPRARNFGARTWYEGTRGNKTAIFPSYQAGCAALVNRLLRDEGLTVRDYILGGDKIDPEMSYSGGQDYRDYLRAIEQYAGVNGSDAITRDPVFVYRMVKAHARAEGNRRVPVKSDIPPLYNLIP